MNNRQLKQAVYFDNSDWLTKNHNMQKVWTDSASGGVYKCCVTCEQTIVITRGGRVEGTLKMQCDEKQSRPLMEETSRSGKQLTLL